MYTSNTEEYVEILTHLRIMNRYTLNTQSYKQIYPHINLRTTFTQPLGFPVAQMVKNLPAMQDTQV